MEADADADADAIPSPSLSVDDVLETIEEFGDTDAASSPPGVVSATNLEPVADASTRMLRGLSEAPSEDEEEEEEEEEEPLTR